MKNKLRKLMFRLEPGMWHGSATETVWVDPVGRDQYRLENSPFYVFGVSYQDVVRAKEENGILIFDGIVSGAGHSTYRVIRAEKAEAFGEYWVPLQQLGCSYEEGINNLLSVDVPPFANIHKVYELLNLGEQAGVWSFEEGHCGHPL